MMRAFVAVFLLTALGTSARAQAVLSSDHGTQVFRVILHRLGMTSIDSIDDATHDPSKTLIVMLGRTDTFDHQFRDGGLRRYLRAGGAILVATDRATGDPLQSQLEFQISGFRVEYLGGNSSMVYRGELRECILVQPPTRPLVQSPDVNLLKGLKNVATNRPSCFLRYPMQRFDPKRCVAELPAQCKYGLDSYMNFAETPMMFAFADRLGSGRYCVIADHSIFINSMLLQVDNDNIAFTTNIINWLTENGKRNRVLFVDEGQIRTEFNINLDYLDPPLPHPDVLAPAIDKLIVGLEHDDFFNRTFLSLIPLHRIQRGMLFGLTVLLAAVLLYRITAGKLRREPQAVRLPDQVESLAEPAIPDSTRPREPSVGEIGSAAQELAYRTFHDLLGNDLNRPPVVHAAGVMARRSWNRRVRFLWQIASGHIGRTMSPTNLKSLTRRLEELRRAVDRGDVTLSLAEGSP